jgi:hypothetical protein
MRRLEFLLEFSLNVSEKYSAKKESICLQSTNLVSKVSSIFIFTHRMDISAFFLFLKCGWMDH